MIHPATIPGSRGPHFSLALFGPLNPTRAATAPAWCVPLDRNATLPLLFPKEPVSVSPLPISGRDHLLGGRNHDRVATHVGGGARRLRRLADGRPAGVLKPREVSICPGMRDHDRVAAHVDGGGGGSRREMVPIWCEDETKSGLKASQIAWFDDRKSIGILFYELRSIQC